MTSTHQNLATNPDHPNSLHAAPTRAALLAQVEDLLQRVITERGAPCGKVKIYAGDRCAIRIHVDAATAADAEAIANVLRSADVYGVDIIAPETSDEVWLVTGGTAPETVGEQVTP